MNANDTIENLTRITQAQRAGLKKLGILTIRDLLYHFPSRYESAADIKQITEAKAGETVTFYGQFSKLEMKKSWTTKVPMAEGNFSDETGTMRVVWFHQPYLAKMIPTDTLVRLRGKVAEKNGRKSVVNPEVEKAAGIPFMQTKDGLSPVYPESAGITSLWFYHALKRARESGIVETLEDPIPEKILSAYHLPKLATALVWIHEPRNEKNAGAARKRFAFEEVFLIQVARAKEREANKEKRSFEIDADEKRVAEFVKVFPFEPTAGQKKAVGEI